MDLAEPPRIVFEQPAPCRDASRAEQLLRRALAPSVAPHGGWTVTVRVTRLGARLHAEGEITDEAEAPVAHRALDGDTRECAALAKGLGVWASLVLDQEAQRVDGSAPPPPVTLPPVTPPPPPPAWPVSSAHEKPTADGAIAGKPADDRRSLEIGASSFLMAGTGAGVLAGPSLFGVVEVGRGWFLRPQLAVGGAVTGLSATSDVYATWGGTRFDACRRVAGNYLDTRGMQLDLCGGADLGFLRFDPRSDAASTGGPTPSSGTLPFFALGPSLALRGELGSDLSVVLRVVADVNVLRGTFADATTLIAPSPFVERGELGLSWRLR